ncbi:MAG TPA: alternative ribosome rescue aminoacyl-tRNA hydrolase ArfB [Anaerolineales bacterium]|jgi:ribosome-associated protein
MIEISPTIRLEDSEITYDYIRASGPGGQNINKVSTAVQLRFDLRNSPSLPPEVKERLIHLAANRLTVGGILVIEAKRFRSQEQNRADALSRLVSLVRQSLYPPKKRHPTRPTLASRIKRVDSKKRRGDIKKLRKNRLED